MDLMKIGLLALLVIGLLFLLWIIIGIAYKKDEKEIVRKWIIVFNKKTKKFAEHYIPEYEETIDEVVIHISNERLYYSFLAFCKEEKYHVCMEKQAHKVFEIYLNSRRCDNENK